MNKNVAEMLKKLLIEFTKSRPRQTNDNALVEGKNAAVVRKIFGYTHIPKRYAKQLNQFNDMFLNPYVNYHRPSLFSSIIIDKKGKEKKYYKYNDVMTPYEKLKSLPQAKQYLKKGITFDKLDQVANAISDNEAAERLQKQRKLLFKQLHEDSKIRA